MRHQATVEGWAARLQSAFPPREDAPLARRLLRLLAKGRAASAAALAEGVGTDPAAAASALESWPNVELDRAGHVVSFSGLSLTPTPHRFEVGGQSLYAWCAWDTLFLPALLGEPATVRSTCPMTGTNVELEVTLSGVTHTQPGELFVSFPPVAITGTNNITSSFCCHVHFLAGAAAADAWRKRHPDGMVFDLEAAYELGRRTVAPLLALAQPEVSA
ncbi:MAG: alkylmercury lyase MerB [Actinobacteria bacterium]|nr:alkylmercury lyase MerB [Actinomycetota bacterium]